MSGGNLFVYQVRRSLAWSQQGFWQLSFCRQRNLGSLCFDGRTMMEFFCIPSMGTKKSVDSSIFHPSSFPILPLSSWTQNCPQGSFLVALGVIPGQSTEVLRTWLKNIFFHEKPQIYTTLRYLNMFFNTFLCFRRLFLFFKDLGTFTFL